MSKTKEALISWEERTRDDDEFRRQAVYSGIPIITHMTRRLFTFLPGKGTQKAYDAALKFVAERDGKPLREHHFLTFGGEPGRGKTHLALGIGWHWLEHKKGTVKYYQVADFLETLRNEYDDPPKDRYGMPIAGAYEHCKGASLLILDDLGAEKGTEWAVERLDMLVDYRWLNEKPTVVTTNKLLSQLSIRVASRLKEGITVALEGIDYREYKAKIRGQAAKGTEKQAGEITEG